MTKTTMPALLGGLGAEWELRDVDVPTPGPGQVLVRVRAAALNRADLYMLEGTYNPGGAARSTYTAGLELAGEVEAVGEGVEGVCVDDRVMAAMLGGFARYALVDHRHLMPVPPSVGWTEAGALPVGLQTEHDALVTQCGFRSGQSVLITGASSGMGTIGIQLAKALGSRIVLATTTSDAKVEALKAVGADVVVNTTTMPLAETVLATAREGVDIVLDHVGGQVFADALSATRIRGTLINIGRLAGGESTISLDRLAFRRLRVIGTTFSIRTAEERAEVCAALAPVVLPAVGDGRIRPVIDAVFSLEDFKQAAERMRSSRAIGKIVLEIP